MHDLDDLNAGFDEGGGDVSRASGQQGFAVIVNRLGQSPVTHHDVEFRESVAPQFGHVTARHDGQHAVKGVANSRPTGPHSQVQNAMAISMASLQVPAL